jgi:hypothetical protein
VTLQALIFDRKVMRTTPGRSRTRVITAGVAPFLYVDYKSSFIKQYAKEGLALRTETVVNDPRDFAVAKRLHNLPALREVGFSANRRLLDVESISHDCAIGEDAFNRVTAPVSVPRHFASTTPESRRSSPCSCRLPTWPVASPTQGHARPARASAGHRPGLHDPGQDDLRPPPTAPARADRAHLGNPPLPRHRQRPADRVVL